MQVLNEEDLLKWLDRRELSLGRDRQLKFRADNVSSVRIAPPRDFTRLAYLCYSLVLLTVPEESDFAGVLLWQRAFSLGETPLYRMAELLWTQAAPTGMNSPGLGRLFDSTECLPAATNALIALGFEWDSYIVPSAGDYFVYKHHDETVDVVSPFDHVARRIARTLADGGLLTSAGQ
ncbi:MAG TPA: hypothetical protein VGL65_10570 [Gemmatimonadales bacterium]|jgi:hypothetical protein